MLLSDVVVDVKTTFGRCYCQVADVITTIGLCVQIYLFVWFEADGIAMGLL